MALIETLLDTVGTITPNQRSHFDTLLIDPIEGFLQRAEQFYSLSNRVLTQAEKDQLISDIENLPLTPYYDTSKTAFRNGPFLGRDHISIETWINDNIDPATPTTTKYIIKEIAKTLMCVINGRTDLNTGEQTRIILSDAEIS